MVLFDVDMFKEEDDFSFSLGTVTFGGTFIVISLRFGSFTEEAF